MGVSNFSGGPGDYAITIGQSGTYYIAVGGADGSTPAAQSGPGGLGGSIGGDIYLQQGEKLEIGVGSYGTYGGGGGASYIEETYPGTGTHAVSIYLASAGGGGQGGTGDTTGAAGQGGPGHHAHGGLGGSPGALSGNSTGGPGGNGGAYMIGVATGGANHSTSGGGFVLIELEAPAVCFAGGTRILTARGEVAVEDLTRKDLAVTAAGEARPIIWIGHKLVERPTAERWPVCVRAGAFGEGLPTRDLMLSPGHAVCVDVMGEVFTPIEKLINGVTIFRKEVSEVTYWHVELASHDVLLAEGLGCESYMDTGNRAFFGRQYGRLGEIDPRRVAESLRRYARPFVADGPIVEAIRDRLESGAENASAINIEREAA
jgi:hypothetical protein